MLRVICVAIGMASAYFLSAELGPMVALAIVANVSAAACLVTFTK